MFFLLKPSLGSYIWAEHDSLEVWRVDNQVQAEDAQKTQTQTVKHLFITLNRFLKTI